MNLDLINFEVAKLAKEKDFQTNTSHWYNKSEPDVIRTAAPRNHNYPKDACTISAPTQEELQKWLRTEHGVYAFVDWEEVIDVIVDWKNFGGKLILKRDRSIQDLEKEDDINDLLIEALNYLKL